MFTFNERLGIFFTIEACFLSLLAVAYVFYFVVYKWLRRRMLTWGRSNATAMDASDSSLFLNLMLADFIQALGSLPNIQWMENAGITEGRLCTAQAAVKQVGIVGVAMTSLAIAVHTFAILVLRWRAPRHISKFLVLGVWAFAGLVIGIPNAIHRNEVYYGDTGYWCWIVETYKTEQIVTEYLWVWVSGILMVIIYGMMFAVMRGWFIVENGVHWHKNYKSRNFDMEPKTDEERRIKAIANLMLYYPAVYIICITPNTLSRWLSFSHHKIPYQFTLFADSLLGLSGLFNVVLFFSTRPNLVKGPSIIVEEEGLPLHSRKSSHMSSRHGHLPERTYTSNLPAAYSEGQSVRPDHEFTNVITDSGAYMTRSPSAFNDSLSLPSHDRNSTERDEYRRIHASSEARDEEDFGRLPG